MIVEIYKTPGRNEGEESDYTTVVIDGNANRFGCSEAAFVYADSKVLELQSAIETAKRMFTRT